MIQRNSVASLVDIFFLPKSSSPLANLPARISSSRTELALSLSFGLTFAFPCVLGLHQRAGCHEDLPTTGYTARARDVGNLGRGQVISDRLVLPSVGLLRGVPPWGHLVTLVRERDRLLTRDRLEASGLLCGSISGEVDHKLFGLARAFVSSLLLASPISNWPWSIIPCSKSSATGHASTSCVAPGCIKQVSSSPPSRQMMPASRSAFNINLLEVIISFNCFGLWSPHSSIALTAAPP